MKVQRIFISWLCPPLTAVMLMAYTIEVLFSIDFADILDVLGIVSICLLCAIFSDLIIDKINRK